MSSPSFAYSNERDANETRKKKIGYARSWGREAKPLGPKIIPRTKYVTPAPWSHLAEIYRLFPDA